MKPQKITWLHGALSYADRHEMSADERIAAEKRALAFADENDSEVIVTVCDTAAVVEARTMEAAEAA